jgi:hypothetical protein
MHSQKHCRLGNIYERFEFAVAFDLLHLLLLAANQVRFAGLAFGSNLGPVLLSLSYDL